MSPCRSPVVPAPPAGGCSPSRCRPSVGWRAMVRLADVVAVLEAAYPPALAQDWDAVGLVCGDPDDKVGSVVVAVDPVADTVDEALTGGAQLLLTHHPL